MQNEIESELDKIEHYQKFPLMKPFIGENYFNNTKKLLIVGESHFFDHQPPSENPKINPGATVWYSSSENDLDDAKKACINTRNTILTSKHKVFTEIENVLNQSFEKYNNRAFNNVSFMNGFQRPSNIRGQSIKEIASEKDFEVSLSTISKVIEILKPNFVIFVSKYTWDTVGTKLSKNENIIYDYTCHPAAYGDWNDKNNPNSKYKITTLLV